MKTPTKQTARSTAGMLAGIQAGHAQAATDRKLAVAADGAKAVAVLAIANITPRADDTRPARADHVLALAESVAAVGLLQPPAVDRHHRLIAGLNRLEACRLLAAAPGARADLLAAIDGAAKMDPKETKARLAALPDPDELPEPLKAGKIPASVLIDLDAIADPAAALAAEVAENTARKAYTPTEVADLVGRLRRGGYKETTGRPRKGEKALRPAIGLVLGVSPATVRRYLGTRKDGQTTTFSEDPEAVLAHETKKLLRALAAYLAAGEAVTRMDLDGADRAAMEMAKELAQLLT